MNLPTNLLVACSGYTKQCVEVICRHSSAIEQHFSNMIQLHGSLVSVLTHASKLVLNLLLNQDAELQTLGEATDQLEEHHANNEAIDTTPTLSAQSASASFQPLSSETSSIDSHPVPIISSKHHSYPCSWRLHDSGAQCDHVAPDRPAFLHHLAEIHQVSGNANATMPCLLLNPKIGSACTTSIKRGNFPRHVDTHYPFRYHCEQCPTATSFSRQDSWKKHMRSKHA